MKIYKISKSVKRIPFIFAGITILFFSILIITGIVKYENLETFLYILIVGMTAFALFYYIALFNEKVILDDSSITHKKLSKKQTINWSDIKEVELSDSWTALPAIILKSKGMSLVIDYHSYSEAEDLKDKIFFNLRHLKVKQKFEFTEL